MANDLAKLALVLGGFWVTSRIIGGGGGSDNGGAIPFGGGAFGRAIGAAAKTTPDTLADVTGDGSGDEDIGTTSSATMQEQEVSTQNQPQPVPSQPVPAQRQRRVFTQPNVAAPVASPVSQGRFIATGKIPRLGAGESATIPSATATARVMELRRQAGDEARRESARITGDFISTGSLPVIASGKSVTVPSSVAGARVEELRNRFRLRESDGASDFSNDEDIGATSPSTSKKQDREDRRTVDRYSLGAVVS